MGTKTVDETEAGKAAQSDEVTGADEATTADEATESGEPAEAADGDGERAGREEGAPGVGQGAGAILSVALGVVSLTGSWIGTVAAARETLIGQLETSSSAGVAQQIKEVYGDAWKTSALWAGLFALVALVVAAVVLARPAFGAPGRPQAAWIKSVAWAGLTLGVIGLFLAVLKYTDVLLGLPSAS
ncbi:hypothetical protein ACIF8T_17165 [Streptomyces sp. NPDC085946]|uniref:hypothetical protein n=1 Tax=Streptomyces sp. NPDC085946 TaxID=3365744 RepID=UPI0037D370F7